MTQKTKMDVYIQYYPHLDRYDFGILNKETKKIKWNKGAATLDRTKQIVEDTYGDYRDLTVHVS
jgi:hypothetical protein